MPGFNNETPAEILRRAWEYFIGPKPIGPCAVCGVDTTETTRGRSGVTQFVHSPMSKDSAGCRDVWQYRDQIEHMMTEEQYIEHIYDEVHGDEMLIAQRLLEVELITDKDYYHDYKSYIASNEWRIRADAMKRDFHYTCEGCNKTANRSNLHIHHKHYQTLYKERRKDLQILCGTCHKATHDRKRSGR